MRLRLLPLVLLLAAGCAPMAPTTAPTPSAPGETRPASRADLDAARARWAAVGTDDYVLTYRQVCFCMPEFAGPYRVTVRDGAIVEARHTETGVVVIPAAQRVAGSTGVEPENVMTAALLFDFLGDAFDRNAEAVNVAFDAATGLPMSSYVDYNAMVADEEMGFQIEAFERL